MTPTPPDDRLTLTPAAVARLIAAQFPRWAGLAVRPVATPGWDNLSFRLGDEMAVRLPSAARYAPQVAKEAAILTRLRALPVAVPEVLATGVPAAGYPFPWSVRRWIEGDPACGGTLADPCRLARALADVLGALHRLDTVGGPPPGAHSFHRGGTLVVYAGEVTEMLSAIGSPAAAGAVWQAALAARFAGPSVWVHGDVAPGNLLLRDDGLCALIDWGSAAVGDPACDLAVAWTLFEGPSRRAFRDALAQPPSAWARARGWALWKALLVLAGRSAQPPRERPAAAVLADIVAEAG